MTNRTICYCFIAIIVFCSVSVIFFTKHIVGVWPDLSPLRLFHGPTVNSLRTVDGPTAPVYYEHLERLTTPCAGQRPQSNRVRNGLWYMTGQSNSGHEVAVFSAYFDDRPSESRKTAVVRVLSVVNWKGHAGPKVHCLLWYYNISHPVVTVAEELRNGRGLSVGDSHYEERLFTCALPTWHISGHVSLTLDSECNPASSLVPISIPPRARMHDFGVCVAVSYGILNVPRFKEWVEFHRLLGVGEFNIYYSKLDKTAIEVFKAYSIQRVVALHQSAPPIDNWCTWCQKLATIAVLNDCLYRNMHRYKYMIVVDVDEIIVPHKDANYSEMLQRIVRTSQSSSIDQFAFRNGYFFLDFPADESQPRELATLRHHVRTAVSQPGVAVKSILNPRACVSMQNHYCATRRPRDATVLMVDTEIALNHHYKRCHLAADECTYALLHGVDDSATLRFRNKLEESVAKQQGITR